MVLRGYGVDVDPGKLVRWLSAESAFQDGYLTADGYSLVAQYPGAANRGVALELRGKAQFSWEGLRYWLEDRHCPVIVNVPYGGAPYGHWVVVYERASGEYGIRDPLVQDRTVLNDYGPPRWMVVYRGRFPLRVVATRPDDGASGVPPTIVPSIRFSAPLADSEDRLGSLVTVTPILLADAVGGQLPGGTRIDLSADARTISIRGGYFYGGRTYTVRVAAGVRSTAGESLSEPYEFSFRVARGQQSGRGPTTTVLVLDRSGSMAWDTSDGRKKLDAAKQAARDALRVIRFDADELRADHQVGIVSFSDSAAGSCPMTDDLSALEGPLQSLRAGGGTDFGDALDAAVSWIEAIAEDRRQGRKVIIFLSDGCTNAGPVSREAFLTDDPDSLPLYRRIRDGEIKVFTVGFGEPGKKVAWFVSLEPDLDEEVLRKIADTPGTGGGYMHAKDAARLSSVYLGNVHAATGTKFFEDLGVIAAGERKPIGPFDPAASRDVASAPGDVVSTRLLSWLVPPAYADSGSDSQMLITLGWNNGTLGLEIRDPSGRVVDEEYPGVHLDTSAQPYCVAVDSPRLGKWTAVVSGDSVPPEGTRYSFIVSARVPPTSVVSGGGGGGQEDVWSQLLLITVVGAVLLLAAAVIIVARRRAAVPLLATPTRVTVSALDGIRQMDLRASVVSIGRAADNDIVVADRGISAHHAVLRHDGQSWSVEDLSSTNGTFVNGQRVLRVRFSPGDEIRVGDTVLRLR